MTSDWQGSSTRETITTSAGQTASYLFDGWPLNQSETASTPLSLTCGLSEFSYGKSPPSVSGEVFPNVEVLCFFEKIMLFCGDVFES